MMNAKSGLLSGAGMVGLALVLASGLGGCDRQPATPTGTGIEAVNSETGSVEVRPPLTQVTSAVARIMPTSPADTPLLSGIMIFNERDGRLHIDGRVANLSPGKTYGLYISTYGDLTELSGSYLGGLYYPNFDATDPENTADRPLGLLGDRTADRWGVVSFHDEIEGLTLGKTRAPILGRALVITEGSARVMNTDGQMPKPIGVGLIVLAKPDSSEPAID